MKFIQSFHNMYIILEPTSRELLIIHPTENKYIKYFKTNPSRPYKSNFCPQMWTEALRNIQEITGYPPPCCSEVLLSRLLPIAAFCHKYLEGQSPVLFSPVLKIKNK